MEPTLYSNNVLVTERITPRLSRIQRGDIIIAKCPTNPNQHICKRIVGLPGDKIISTEPAIYNMSVVEKKNLELNENNNENKSSKITTTEGILSTSIKNEDGNQAVLVPLETLRKLRPIEIVVPRGHVWIEGDNSENSADSRFYGPIPQGLIKSRAVCRLWPLNDIKALI